MQLEIERVSSPQSNSGPLPILGFSIDSDVSSRSIHASTIDRSIDRSKQCLGGIHHHLRSRMGLRKQTARRTIYPDLKIVNYGFHLRPPFKRKSIPFWMIWDARVLHAAMHLSTTLVRDECGGAVLVASNNEGQHPKSLFRQPQTPFHDKIVTQPKLCQTSIPLFCLESNRWGPHGSTGRPLFGSRPMPTR